MSTMCRDPGTWEKKNENKDTFRSNKRASFCLRLTYLGFLPILGPDAGAAEMLVDEVTRSQRFKNCICAGTGRDILCFIILCTRWRASPRMCTQVFEQRRSFQERKFFPMQKHELVIKIVV
jgi:hypothetical protein